MSFNGVNSGVLVKIYNLNIVKLKGGLHRVMKIPRHRACVVRVGIKSSSLHLHYSLGKHRGLLCLLRRLSSNIDWFYMGTEAASKFHLE